MATDSASPTLPRIILKARLPGDGDCWNHIGVSGDRSCPELNAHIHCRNCPVFAEAAAPSSTGRPPRTISQIGPDGWPNQPAWACASHESEGEDDNTSVAGEAVSVLIFRLGEEWLAFRTQDQSPRSPCPGPCIEFLTAPTRF